MFLSEILSQYTSSCYWFKTWLVVYVCENTVSGRYIGTQTRMSVFVVEISCRLWCYIDTLQATADTKYDCRKIIEREGRNKYALSGI